MRLLERLLNVRGSAAGKVVATALTVLLVTPLTGIKASTDSQEATDSQVASDITQVIDDVDSDAIVDDASAVVDPVETDDPAVEPQPEDEAPAVTEDEEAAEPEEAPTAPADEAVSAEDAVPAEVQTFFDAVKALEAFGPVDEANADAFAVLGQKAMDAYEAVQNAGLEGYEGVSEALATLTALMDSVTGGTETTASGNVAFENFPVTFSLDNPRFVDPFSGNVWEKVEGANVTVGQTIIAEGPNNIDLKTEYYINSIDPKTKTITATVIRGAKGGFRLPAASQLWTNVLGVVGLDAYSPFYGGEAHMYEDISMRWCEISYDDSWFSEQEAQENLRRAGVRLTYMPGADDIVTDKWRYRAQLDFEAMGTDVEGLPATMTAHSDKEWRLFFDLSAAQPTRKGYTFQGWSYFPNDPQNIIPSTRFNIDCRDGELTTQTLYAIWKLDPLNVVNREYTVEITPEGFANDDPYGSGSLPFDLPQEMTIGYASSYECTAEGEAIKGLHENSAEVTLKLTNGKYVGTLSVPLWDIAGAKAETGEGDYLSHFVNHGIQLTPAQSLGNYKLSGEFTMAPFDPESGDTTIAISLEYVEKIKYQVKWLGTNGETLKALEFYEDAPELDDLESLAPTDMITVPEGMELIWMRSDAGMFPGMENPSTEIIFTPYLWNPNPVDPDVPPEVTTVTIQWLDGFGSLLHVQEGVEVADSYTYPNADPTWPGYRFLGWSEPEDLGNGTIRIVALWERTPSVVIPVPITPEVTQPPAQAPEEAPAPMPLTIADVPAVLGAAAEAVADFMDTPVFSEPEPMTIDDAENPLAAPGGEPAVGEAIRAFTWGDYYIVVGVAAVAIIAAGALLRKYKISHMAAAMKDDSNE